MLFPSALTRTQFNQACLCFIRKWQQSTHDPITRPYKGWQWHEHSTISGLGYMSRLGSALQISASNVLSNMSEDNLVADLAEDLVEDDISTFVSDMSAHRTLIVNQYVVYSPTFQVPAFYFTVQNSEGSLLSLQEIMQSTLFRYHALPENIITKPHGISLPMSNFPVLSQGDHPILGTPCWYFHPCQTSTAVVELLHEVPAQDGMTADESLLLWLETWFLILCGVIDL